MTFETEYRTLVQDIINLGDRRQARNGKTRALFATSLRIDELRFERFPLLTQRQIFYKGVFGELAAFVRGATTIGEFKKWGCNYWDANAIAWPRNKGLPLEEMSIGQVYGAQWVNWEGTGYNQLTALRRGLEFEPHGRRHLLTSYSPTAISCLPPCHLMAQFYVTAKGEVDCQVYMRSVDVILGLPSDVALYAALLVDTASQVGLRPGVLTFAFGDTHIYENHVEMFKEEHEDNTIVRCPEFETDFTEMHEFTPDSIRILNYKHSGPIKYVFNV